MKDRAARRIGSTVLFFVIFTGALSVMQGCRASAVAGSPFIEINEIPPDHGLVYIYRPVGEVGGDMANTVTANDERVFLMHNGGYHPYFAKLGKVEFRATGGRESAVIDVVPQKVYYISASVHWNMAASRWWGPLSLDVVSADIGAKEIKKCNLENN